MNILSIQSSVAYGHVGNSAAVFPLQRLGAEVWAIDTVQFSNHPGHGTWTGRVAAGAEIAAIVDGIERLGVLAECDAVLSGYLGDEGAGAAMLEAVARVRAANPAALYCCDPVMGDAGRLYVRPGIPDLFASRAVPQADLLTPNQFELEQLAGAPCRTRDAVRASVGSLRARMAPTGPRAVLVTSVQTEETPPGFLDMVAADDQGTSAVQVPLLDVAASGAGDALAALFLFHFLRERDAAAAMAEAAGSVHGILRQTARAGARDLLLVAAQDEITAPSLRFFNKGY